MFHGTLHIMAKGFHVHRSLGNASLDVPLLKSHNSYWHKKLLYSGDPQNPHTCLITATWAVVL